MCGIGPNTYEQTEFYVDKLSVVCVTEFSLDTNDTKGTEKN
jgi:hypothetical protein